MATAPASSRTSWPDGATNVKVGRFAISLAITWAAVIAACGNAEPIQGTSTGTGGHAGASTGGRGAGDTGAGGSTAGGGGTVSSGSGGDTGGGGNGGALAGSGGGAGQAVPDAAAMPDANAVLDAALPDGASPVRSAGCGMPATDPAG